MNWNAVRHVPGSSTDPDADTIKVIMDRRGGFSSMVMVIHAGNDQMFWQVCAWARTTAVCSLCCDTALCATSCRAEGFFRFYAAGCGCSRRCLHTHH